MPVSEPWNYGQIFLKMCLHGECLLHIKFGFVETFVLYCNKFPSAPLTQPPLGKIFSYTNFHLHTIERISEPSMAMLSNRYIINVINLFLNILGCLSPSWGFIYLFIL